MLLTLKSMINTQLGRFFQDASDVFLAALGKTPEEIKGRDRKYFAWASVHQNGIHHMMHTHPNNMLSGVYYVKVPNGSGPLVFSDPRGEIPPFDEALIVKPSEGVLVLFPSWLGHEVLPTGVSDPRISIAFNMPGEWADTSGLTSYYPLYLET